MRVKSMYKSLFVWLLIGMSMILLFNLFNVPPKSERELIFSDFLEKSMRERSTKSPSRTTTSRAG